MRNGRTGQRQRKNLFTGILLLTAVCSLFGCRGLELENKTEQVEEYTRPQAMILVANERNRYENVYSEGIWEITVGDDEVGLDRLTVQNVKSYMEQLKLLCMLAEERGITVTSQEKDTIRQITDAYMAALTEADRQYIGCDRSDVQKLYTDYFTADKLIRSVTGQINSEISDSEAKVIRVEQIGTTDRRKALAILKRVKIDGANFSSMASRYTETDSIDLVLRRGAGGGLLERTAFQLEEGQVSNILHIGEMYYIIKCTDGYAREATLERKNRLTAAMNTKAFYDVLAPYQQEHRIRFVERFWNEMNFGEDGGSTVENFFDIYEEAMK